MNKRVEAAKNRQRREGEIDYSKMPPPECALLAYQRARAKGQSPKVAHGKAVDAFSRANGRQGRLINSSGWDEASIIQDKLDPT